MSLQDDLNELQQKKDSRPPMIKYGDRPGNTIPNNDMNNNLDNVTVFGDVSADAAQISLDSANDAYESKQSAETLLALITGTVDLPDFTVPNAPLMVNSTKTGVIFGDTSVYELRDSLAALPTVKPVLMADFVNSGQVDGRFEFSRASLDWDEEGNEYGINEPVLTDKGLWVSGRRINYLLESSDLRQSVWTKTTYSDISQSPTLMPDGNYAYKFISRTDSNVSTASRQLSQYLYAGDLIGLEDDPITISCRFKAGEITRAAFDLSSTNGSDFTDNRLWVNLDTGEITNITGVNVEYVTAKTFPLGGGAYEIHITQNRYRSIGASTLWFRTYLISNPGESVTFNGEVGDGFFLWNCQVEKGSTASPYIPTEGSQVTVAESTISIMPPLNRGYTIFAEFDLVRFSEMINTSTLSIYNNVDERVRILIARSSKSLSLSGRVDGSTTTKGVVVGTAQIGINKIAMTISRHEIKGAAGGEIGILPVASTIDLTNSLVNIGNYRGAQATQNEDRLTGFFRNIRVFDRVFSDVELQELTS